VKAVQSDSNQSSWEATVLQMAGHLAALKDPSGYPRGRKSRAKTKAFARVRGVSLLVNQAHVVKSRMFDLRETGEATVNLVVGLSRGRFVSDHIIPEEPKHTFHGPETKG
jgi:hypothetical protein